MSTERAHAILGASSSKRWMTCPGSIRLGKGAPEKPTSKYASEGTAAHELLEKCLLHNKDAKDAKGKVIQADNLKFIVDDEMIEAVQIAIDYVRSTHKEVGGELQCETRFNLGWLHPGMFGTNDVCVSQEFGELHVIDYKHGAGVAVNAEDNPQLLYYAIGAAYDTELHTWRDFESVTLTIVQPRCFHEEGPIRSWTITMDYLKQFAGKLKKAAIATEAPDAPLHAGDHCRWCPAAGFCTQIHKMAVDTARTEFGVKNLPPAESLTPEQIGKVIQVESTLKAWMENVREYALHLTTMGKEVPGTKLVRKRSAHEWKDEDHVRRSLGQSFPMEKVYNMKLKTVAQMEKSVGKETVKDLYVTLEGDITIAKESDKRKAVTFKKGE